ncbi:MAG: hypothetical protein EX270_10775, partial [Pseudomonadales bacterium]
MDDLYRPSARGLATLAVAMLAHPAANATLKDDIGYTALSGMLGASLPDGEVAVFQIEANENEQNWIADSSNPDFAGKTIVGLSAPPSPAPSSHATGVGRSFYGNTVSTSPGITDIGAHSVIGWLFEHLAPGTVKTTPPIVTHRRVANHSWVGGGLVDASGNLSPEDTSSMLRHADWVSDVDELVQVYGANNSSNDRVFMSTALNGITAGVTDATHSDGVVALDDIYVAGRPALHLVTPVATTSSSTPTIASAAALLIDAAQQNPSWSESTTSNRQGTPIYNAERGETIKAALMAGASRITYNTTMMGDIVDYREDAANRTDNGLDWRYGAGQLNMLRSYQILAAGESASAEDDGVGNLGFTGFDHDDKFGGHMGSNTIATYDLGTTNISIDLHVALVWNLAVTGAQNNTSQFDESAQLHNLDLELIDVGAGDAIVAASTSSIANTENIWITLEPYTHYQLRVTRAAGQSNFAWDYSIAWSEAPATTFFGNVPLPFWSLIFFAICLAKFGV